MINAEGTVSDQIVSIQQFRRRILKVIELYGYYSPKPYKHDPGRIWHATNDPPTYDYIYKTQL